MLNSLRRDVPYTFRTLARNPGFARVTVLALIGIHGVMAHSVTQEIGIAAAAGAGRLLATQLYQVKPFDPLTFAAVGAALLVTGLAACLVPALRAMHVDLLVALRNE
jgi:putative ABC transport system permease protein